MSQKLRGNEMKQTSSIKERKNIAAKLTITLRENVRELSTDLQTILIDDLVTAYQNRMKVLMCAQQKMSHHREQCSTGMYFKSIKALYKEPEITRQEVQR